MQYMWKIHPVFNMLYMILNTSLPLHILVNAHSPLSANHVSSAPLSFPSAVTSSVQVLLLQVFSASKTEPFSNTLPFNNSSGDFHLILAEEIQPLYQKLGPLTEMVWEGYASIHTATFLLRDTSI